MAWDIHGNTLERGHCEVHPWVHQEYPCSVCYDESRRQQEKKDQERRERQQYEQSMTQEPIYTKEQLTLAFDAGFSQGLDVGENGINSTKPDFNEWFDKNIK